MGEMNIVDWSQVVIAVGTAIAAISSLVVTVQNSRANVLMREERHLMVKPQFRITGTFEDRLKKNAEINVINFGFDRIMNTIFVSWEGTDGVSASAKEIIKREKGKDDIDYKITIDYSKCPSDERNIQGKLYLNYLDVLGRAYNESVDIHVQYKYYETVDQYSPELMGSMVGQIFK